ncbi:Mur ligase family protein [Candidatus Gottesmanbacteria bacterium]|nr:Mur ligase family protein [Candidatus Gottesmanbacteria bacterium]
MPLIITSLISKAVSIASRFFGIGAGVTWAGEIGLTLDPKIINKLIPQVKKGVIVIAGTNGKTTTSAMVKHILNESDYKVIHNKTGANLENGIAGTLLLNTNFLGKLSIDFAIFELDEGAFPKVITKLNPKIIVLLNLFRDQLDRYGEVDSIAQKWMIGLKGVSDKTTLVCNADDPLISEIGNKFKGKVVYFGLNDSSKTISKLPHAVDSTYCLNCGNKLSYKKVFLSHFGDWYCTNCHLKRPKLTLNKINSPLIGVYNEYNSLASSLTCQVLGISKNEAQQKILTFTPAFGRQEEFNVNSKKIKIFLSKNPAGFNESLRTVLTQKDFSTIIFALNDRIADGTDVSWIWDVDFDEIVSKTNNILCTGDRANDMAIRIKYAGDKDIKPIFDLNKAIEKGLENTRENETLYILPTYTAMLDIRKILTGKKIS